jgi:hypothetical protein
MEEFVVLMILRSAVEFGLRIVGGVLSGIGASLGEPGGGMSYHCTCWSNTYSG